MISMEEFNRLLKRYLRGEALPEEEKQLEEWYKNQPEEVYPDLPEEEKYRLEKKVWREIRSGIADSRPVWKRAWGWTGAAAFVALGFLGFLRSGGDEKTVAGVVSGQKRFEIKNTTGSDQEIRLSDSTVVLLKQNSTLVYEDDFNREKRGVRLSGEAFFEVKRNEMKPFVVYTGDLVTEVLGTSFRIRENRRSNTTEVSVTSGKVSVYADGKVGKDERNGVILTANQQASYSRATNHIVAGIVEEPVPRTSEPLPLPSLDFHSVPLQDVLDALTRHYGIEFVIADPRVKDCGINADLTGLSMFTQLELICKSIDAVYERRGTVVFISGEGC